MYKTKLLMIFLTGYATVLYSAQNCNVSFPMDLSEGLSAMQIHSARFYIISYEEYKKLQFECARQRLLETWMKDLKFKIVMDDQAGKRGVKRKAHETD